MNQYLPEFPVVLVDFLGSSSMILLSFLAIGYAYRLLREEPRQLLWSYLLMFTLALAAFSVGRGVGHIVRNVLVNTGHRELWLSISPYSGALNTITFVIIAAITFYYHFVEKAFLLLRQANSKLVGAFAEIRRNRDRIILLERYAVCDRMAAKLAHETRNPIFTIANFAKLLLRKLENDEASAAHLRIIVEESQKLEGLIDGIMKVRHDLPQLMKRVSGREVLSELEGISIKKAEASGVGVRVARLEEEFWLFLDIRSLLSGLTELIVNAIEASSEGDTIDISVLREDNMAVFRVSDRGKGIPQKSLPRIFEPGFSTKQFSAGLGLAYAKQILEANHGVVKIESVPGEGTLAIAAFPLDTDEAEHAYGAQES
ncbi:integral membrane sensor signal transduction histidine kinase [Pseudodesulfovibrio mercurii]|uniref:histidine kinase n=1 Tax=Pseudodesulfovibrio mercurii TaxID=641491 RepID=F0JDW4_9BACT|nr:HAMP domain-containing sensor histidine kinase [Pseudodesulfovibrio mercurii]EGB13404.1 integral membrane sensor signal transduction histidine kinase [Pseudodesulfovibrio mercurii]